jgi:tetratricopeptide (TPR) repeat protein
MDEGGYVLSAKSLTDSSLVSDVVQTDSSNTVTGNLTVNLSLREAPTSVTRKAGVIRVDEVDQRIPKNARKAFDEGIKFKDRGDSEKALTGFNRAIELYPEYYQALTERGDLFVNKKNLDEAGANFDLALHFNSHYGPALRGAGYCSLEKQNYEEAITKFEQALLEDPTNASTHLLLGITNLQLNRLEAARGSLTKALSFNPPPLRAHVHLANLYAKEHLYQQAIDELKAYLALEIDIPDRADLEAVQAKWRALLVSP